MSEKKKQTEKEDNIMKELREIRAKNAERFSSVEEELAYWKSKEEELKKEGWVFSYPRKNKKSADVNK